MKQLVSQAKPISKPVLDDVKKLQTISTEKIYKETTVILDGRSSEQGRDLTTFGPITPKYTKAGLNLNSGSYVDRFGAGSVVGWQNCSSINSNNDGVKEPQSAVVTEMKMFTQGVSRESTQLGR